MMWTDCFVLYLSVECFDLISVLRGEGKLAVEEIEGTGPHRLQRHRLRSFATQLGDEFVLLEEGNYRVEQPNFDLWHGRHLAWCLLRLRNRTRIFCGTHQLFKEPSTPKL